MVVNNRPRSLGRRLDRGIVLLLAPLRRYIRVQASEVWLDCGRGGHRGKHMQPDGRCRRDIQLGTTRSPRQDPPWKHGQLHVRARKKE